MILRPCALAGGATFCAKQDDGEMATNSAIQTVSAILPKMTADNRYLNHDRFQSFRHSVPLDP